MVAGANFAGGARSRVRVAALGCMSLAVCLSALWLVESTMRSAASSTPAASGGEATVISVDATAGGGQRGTGVSEEGGAPTRNVPVDVHSVAGGGACRGRHARYLTSRALRACSGAVAAESVRVAVPLLVTHTKYHGTSLLKTTVKGWVLKLLLPQKNMDLLLFHDETSAPIGALRDMLGLQPAEGPAAATHPHLTAEEVAASAPSSFWTIPAVHSSFTLETLGITLPLPKYAQEDAAVRAKIANDSSWLTCGCPPYCPARRATRDYVQGTRWYTHQLFLERGGLIARRYDYWVKLDVDIWMFRAPAFNLGGALASSGALFAHTGHAYNGHGCSRDLHQAILGYCGRVAARRPEGQQCPMASANDTFWRQDDNVFYSNFVISSVGFHASGLASLDAAAAAAVDQGHRDEASPFGLAAHLNEEPAFFKYRWTDQSLFHKVFGVFVGPNASAYALDWSCLRWEKKRFKAGSCFRHGKRNVPGAELKRWTDLDQGASKGCPPP